MTTLEDLLAQWEAGTLTPEGAADLKRLLATPEARAQLVDEWHTYEAIASALRSRAAGADPQGAAPPQSCPPPRAEASATPAPNWTLDVGRWTLDVPGFARRWSVPALAAALILALTATLNWRPASPPPNPPAAQNQAPDEATTAAVAVLTRAVAADWADPAAAHPAGAALNPGWLRLKSGLLQIEFHSGARVVLEGPAELQLLSPTEAFCQSGRLRADVPPQASGFRINTPQLQVIDRGTAFGLDVTARGAEVHVIQGEVQVQEPAAGRRDLLEGQALAVEGGALRALPARPEAFTSPADVARRSSALLQQRYQAWRGAGLLLNADSSLLVRFDFENAAPHDRSLRNASASPAAAGDGVIVGCGWSEGRWPGKSALEFRRLSDRVRLSIPDQFRALTAAAWVRVDGTDRTFNSLFMTDGFDPGEIHWQITRQGAVRLGLQGAPGQPGGDYDSPVVFTPERLGHWTHLAVVVDTQTRQVTHYVNGAAVGQLSLKGAPPLRIGNAELGNWNMASHPPVSPIRYLSGRLDEFVLFSRALTPKEIADLAAMGSLGQESGTRSQESGVRSQ